MSAVNQRGKYQPYPDYKDSGVEWLDAIPAEWDILRIDSVAEYIRESKTPSWLSNKTVVHYSIPAIQEFGVGQIEDGGELDSNKLLVESGDLLVSKLNPRKGTICTVQQHKQPIVASTEFIALRTSSVNSKYFDYLFKSQELSGFICSQVESATRSHQRVNPVVIYKSKLLYPSITEREKIISFLDYETARIDQLIAKQQQLIELLKEKRQAVISHAVTKGLNPNAPMKDTGVEWLGQVPEHWVVTSIKHLVSHPIIDGPHVTPVKLDEGIPFISAEALSTGCINFDKKWGYISHQDHRVYSKRYSPKRGDILMIKLGATTGTCAIVDTDEDFNIWVPLAVIRPKPSVSAKFMLYLMKSDFIINNIRVSWTYGTQQTLGLNTLANMCVTMPPHDEQLEIVNHIENKTPALEKTIAIAEKSKLLLIERRTALISAAVTGKIDLRGWQPPKREVAA